MKIFGETGNKSEATVDYARLGARPRTNLPTTSKGPDDVPKGSQKINSDVEKVTTNSDANKEEVVEDETKADPEAEEPAKESDETIEEAAGDETEDDIPEEKTEEEEKFDRDIAAWFNQEWGRDPTYAMIRQRMWHEIRYTALGRNQVCPDCPILCPRRFKRGFELRKHQKAEHLKHKFTCPICGATYSWEKGLRQHNKKNH